MSFFFCLVTIILYNCALHILILSHYFRAYPAGQLKLNYNLHLNGTFKFLSCFTVAEYTELIWKIIQEGASFGKLHY
jgi:hypothetical protein